MRPPFSVLEDTEWDRLGHAYGPASDAPGELERLLGGDAESCGEALAYLDAAILHQGSIYSATAPAVFVAGILDDPRTDRREGVAGRLLREVHDATPVERAGIALTVGGWGVVPGPLVADEHPGVRACAALTRALDDDPAALAEVRLALRDPRAADSFFAENPPQLDGQVRFALVDALLRRTTTFDEIADTAVTVAHMTNAYTVDSDWGPLLTRAFPDGLATGQSLSVSQRRFLTAILENDQCWNSVASPMIWFHRLGLPAGREQLRALTTA